MEQEEDIDEATEPKEPEVENIANDPMEDNDDDMD